MVRGIGRWFARFDRDFNLKEDGLAHAVILEVTYVKQTPLQHARAQSMQPTPRLSYLRNDEVRRR